MKSHQGFGARILAATFVVALSALGCVISGSITGCSAIAVWSQREIVKAPSCVVDVPQAPGLVIALNVYGAVLPVVLAIIAILLVVLIARNWWSALCIVTMTTVLFLWAYRSSWVIDPGIVRFNIGNAWFFLVTVPLYLLALVLQIGGRKLTVNRRSDVLSTRCKTVVPRLGDHLVAFAYAYAAGVLGTLFADLARMPEQISAGTTLVHVGGDGFSDAIFKAGLFASIFFVFALLLSAVLRTACFANSRKTRQGISV